MSVARSARSGVSSPAPRLAASAHVRVLARTAYVRCCRITSRCIRICRDEIPHPEPPSAGAVASLSLQSRAERRCASYHESVGVRHKPLAG